MRTQTLLASFLLFTRLVSVVTVALLMLPASALAQASLFDPSFAVGSGVNGLVYSIVIQEDGKIIIGGEFTKVAGQTRTNIARLNGNGQLDHSFSCGTDGAVYRMLKQPDGKILVAGAFTNLLGSTRRGIGRVLTNGAVDVDFDPGDVLGEYDSAFSLGIQADGKILMGTTIYPVQDGALFRLKPNGQMDDSFVQTNLFHKWHIFAIHVRTNGSILLGGGFQAVNGIISGSLALLNANGQLDTSFSSPVRTNSTVTALLQQADGSVLMGGGFWREGFSNKTVLARLTPAMSWDATFTPDPFDPDLGSNLFAPLVQTLRLQSDGKLLIGGNFYEVGGYWRRHVVRLSEQGRVDPCFDPGVGLGGFDGVYALAQQPDGKIVVGGGFSDESSYTNLTRLLPFSDCNAIRVYTGSYPSNYYYAAGNYVAGTCTPGGTNYLQSSTNLIDWITVKTATSPIVYYDSSYDGLDISTLEGGLFFRVKKEY